MRSITSDHWRRRHASLIRLESDFPCSEDSGYCDIIENSPDLTANPEQSASATQTLIAIQAAFENDADATHVITGMAKGQSPHEIQEKASMTAKRYATTQRRIRRKLAREFTNRGTPK